MGKYEPLGEFLRKQRTQEVPLTFREIEKITGMKLPPKAQHHRAWWSNNPDNNVMTKVWLPTRFESARGGEEGGHGGCGGRHGRAQAGVSPCRESARAGAKALCHEGRPASGFRGIEGHHSPR